MKWHRLQSTSVDHWTLVVAKQMQTVIDVINCVVLLQSSHNHAADRRAIKSNYLICQHQQNKLTSFQFNLILQHQTTCKAGHKKTIWMISHFCAAQKGHCYLHFSVWITTTVFQRDSFKKIVRYRTTTKNVTFCCHQESIKIIVILYGKLYGFIIQGIIWWWYNVEFTAFSNETVAI